MCQSPEMTEADQIASVVLEQFEKLLPKRKPQIRYNGVHEWVPLSGIVAKQDGVMRCLSLASEYISQILTVQHTNDY